MGTDKYDAKSVLRLLQDAATPTHFTFTGATGRFYRVYQSEDAASATHLQKWTDAGLGSFHDVGPHSVDIQVTPGTPRRFYRLHVMQADGPWPASTP